MNGIVNPAAGVDRAFYYILGISAALLVMITLTMIWFVIRYRRSRHPVAADIRGNWKLEVVWTLVPTAIALSMFWVGWSSYTGLRNVPANALEIEVYAQMYSWIFVYPDDRETENELVVPLDRPVKLNITSEDVIHSLFIPAFRVKVDAVPGVSTHAWFLPDREGQYFIQCTEFCGVGHADMTASLRVVSGEEYQRWLAAQ
jgi:cytochrome c oxidase subunit 2